MERGFQVEVQDFTRFFATFNFFVGDPSIRAFTVINFSDTYNAPQLESSYRSRMFKHLLYSK
jgi:hypothetical protein